MPITLLPDDEHDQALVRNVRPPDWVNPAPADRYQLVVIGAGAAGLVAAIGANSLGAKVAIVEREHLGGDCLNVGCVPSKALLRAARAAAEVRRAGEFGVRIPEGVTVDFAAVMERMRRVRAGLSPNDSADRLRSLGIDTFFGKAEFAGPDRLRVGGAELRFGRAIIATGARAAMPPIPGLTNISPPLRRGGPGGGDASAGIFTNESIFSLTELPRRLAVIGGGPIGCELAQAFARFGAEVTLIETLPRLLPRDDAQAAELVAQSLQRDGVRLQLNSRVASVSPGVPHMLQMETSGGRATEESDAILVATGRAPNVEGLGLESAGVAIDRKGIPVDDWLQTTNPRVYAAGDVCSQFQFTHAADALARVAIQNALMPLRTRASRLTIPWCTYTDPEVAHVGLTDDEIRQQGIATDTFTHLYSQVDRAILESAAEGFVRVQVQRGTDRILGATIAGAHAGELIGGITIAMNQRLGLRSLAGTIQPYPTFSEGLRKAAEAWNRTRLTPFYRRIISGWLRWMR